MFEHDVIQETLSQIEERIRQVARKAPPPVGDVSLHLLSAGGKRIRPQIVLHAKGVGGKHIGNVVDIAAAAELVHNASLLHDDVIDEAPLRRGQATARKLWGNAHSVLAGDHLMACSLELLENSGVPKVLSSMLTTMRRLVAAEVVQLAHRGKLLPDLDRYYQVIRGKTAALFAWCADAGARSGGADESICEALSLYGEEVGVAFQLCDDLLDLSGSPDELGKSLLTDIAQGVATLPVVLAAEKQPELADALLAQAQENRTDHEGLEKLVTSVRHWVKETGAEEETRQLARNHISCAIEALGPLGTRPERILLEKMARRMADRKH